jgi:hypothetical protein
MSGVKGYEGFGHFSGALIFRREPVGDELTVYGADHDMLAAEH